jgi:hypothetical protein
LINKTKRVFINFKRLILEARSKVMLKKSVAVAAVLLLAVSFLGVVRVQAVHDTQGLDEHCPDHNGHPGKVNNPAFPSTTTLDVNGTEVNVNVSNDGKSVTFTDENGDPIVVEFCIKAADLAGGKQTDSSGSVTWLNHGGQTPEISYIVVYSVQRGGNNPDPDPEPTPAPDDDGEILGGTQVDAPEGSVDAGVGTVAASALGLGGSVLTVGYGASRFLRKKQ